MDFDGIFSLGSLIISSFVYLETKKNSEIVNNIEIKKIDADLISKSRIEWIQNVRKVSADLILASYEFDDIIFHDEKVAAEITRDPNYLKFYKKDIGTNLDDLYISVLKNCSLLLLYFNPSDHVDGINNISNNEIINNIRGVLTSVETIRKIIKGIPVLPPGDRKNVLIRSFVDKFQEEMTMYLKNEWERAKKVEK